MKKQIENLKFEDMRNEMLKVMALVLVVFNSVLCVAQEKITESYSTNRDVAQFSELNLSVSADVILTQGNSQTVKIEATERLLNLIDTEVKGDALTIKWNKKNVRHSEKIKIYITMKNINALRISGSGDIKAKGAIKSKDLELKISGSGNIKLDDVTAENIVGQISGSADISVKGSGTVNEMDLAISGSGDIRADDLPANIVSVKISGSGDCRVYANERLNAKVAGSGDIFYKGNGVVDVKVAGSGSVRRIN